MVVVYTNDNGFSIENITMKSATGYISEGAVVGISFGWIIGLFTLYAIGMLIVRRCVGAEDKSQKSEKPHRKDVPVERESSNDNQRKVYQQNPTMEMIKYTDEDETNKKDSYYKKRVQMNVELNVQEHSE